MFSNSNSKSGKEILVRIVAMLTKLVVRFDPDQYRLRESASGLATPFEDEDDDEHEDELIREASHSQGTRQIRVVFR
jgi:hypothetical protein